MIPKVGNLIIFETNPKLIGYVWKRKFSGPLYQRPYEFEIKIINKKRHLNIEFDALIKFYSWEERAIGGSTSICYLSKFDINIVFDNMKNIVTIGSTISAWNQLLQFTGWEIIK